MLVIIITGSALCWSSSSLVVPRVGQLDVIEVALDRCGSATERRLAIIDRNHDLYLTQVRVYGAARKTVKLSAYPRHPRWFSLVHRIISALHFLNESSSAKCFLFRGGLGWYSGLRWHWYTRSHRWRIPARTGRNTISDRITIWGCYTTLIPTNNYVDRQARSISFITTDECFKFFSDNYR